ncbi:MAG TPA: hypothetical protein VKA50_00915 [Gammaproteobacteria bacterium]|nr:hypothetical protein [Gammaproteobacteria bacterium]
MAWAIMILGIIVSAVGGIWLLVLAFKRSIVWGLVVLFVPFASLVFVVKYWNETKTAFLVSLGGYVVYAGMFYGMIKPRIENSLVAMQRAQAMHERSRHENDATADDLDAIRSNAPKNAGPENTAAAAAGAASPAAISKAPSKSRTTDKAPEVASANAASSVKPSVIRVRNAKNYIGQPMRVTGTNHVVREGTLRDVEGDALLFERRLQGGSMTFRMRSTDIARLESLRR